MEKILSCAQMIDYINKVGVLPLLNLGIPGWSADEVVDPECRYIILDDGSWEWALWQWKGDIIKESHCAYGKFFHKKAAFISQEWWPDFCNWRRSLYPAPAENSIDDIILQTLRESGSMVTRNLRKACGFYGLAPTEAIGSDMETGGKDMINSGGDTEINGKHKRKSGSLRSRFDARIAALQMAGRIVTEDFVYPRDRHGKPYGWGWSLLTTPESLFGPDACHPDRTPQQSCARLLAHLQSILPSVSETRLRSLLK